MRTVLLATLLLTLPASAKVKVVASTWDLGAIVREVGGEQATVTVLSVPTQDPHFVDAKPSLVLKLASADLLVHNGMELEVGWLPVLVTSARNPTLAPGGPGNLDCSTLVVAKEVPTQKVDRSMGDIHPGGNPHYSRDPHNGALVARGIAARLAELAPEHRSLFEANAKKLTDELAAREVKWREQLAPFAGTKVVTYHKSWNYFCDWTGLSQVAFVEPKPGLPPSTAHVAKVLSVMRSQKVPIIIQEEWYSPSTAELLTRQSGAELVRVRGQVGEQERYADYLEYLVTQTVKALAVHSKAAR